MAPAPDEPVRLTISELVARTGVPASSIHHYRRLGLIPEPHRVAANRFLYDSRHEQAIQLVRLLRERRQLSLERIGELLPELLGDTEAFSPEVWQQAAEDYLLEGPGENGVADKLVEVAVEAFSEQGFAEVSVADLCDRAGVAKGTFYRHFDSKGQVFVAAVEAVVDRAAAEFAAEAARAGPAARSGATFARYLRPGLPLLLELAKRAVQGRPEHTELAPRVFRTLAERVGTALDTDHLVGGALIMDAVAHVFAEGIMEASSWDP